VTSASLNLTDFYFKSEDVQSGKYSDEIILENCTIELSPFLNDKIKIDVGLLLFTTDKMKSFVKSLDAKKIDTEFILSDNEFILRIKRETLKPKITILVNRYIPSVQSYNLEVQLDAPNDSIERVKAFFNKLIPEKQPTKYDFIY